jgi:hypothetical protein
MHPNPTKAPKPPTAVTAPFFPFLAMLLTARFKLPNGLVEPQQITFDFYRSLFSSRLQRSVRRLYGSSSQTDTKGLYNS